jgi:hypothetical protein
MNCDLLDISCHVQSAAYEWWAEVGLLNKALIVGGLAGIILGSSLGLMRLLKMIGGWPAVIGFVAIVFGLVLAVLPRKPVPKPPEERVPPPTPFEFGR